MSDTKFTPGPWSVADWMIVGGNGEYVARMTWDNEEPNARLIAAAPDLFLALQAAAEYLDGIPESAAGGDDDAVRIARNAFAALAKARGES
jgi:hypothetical protein